MVHAGTLGILVVAGCWESTTAALQISSLVLGHRLKSVIFRSTMATLTSCY